MRTVNVARDRQRHAVRSATSSARLSYRPRRSATTSPTTPTAYEKWCKTTSPGTEVINYFLLLLGRIAIVIRPCCYSTKAAEPIEMLNRSRCLFSLFSATFTLEFDSVRVCVCVCVLVIFLHVNVF